MPTVTERLIDGWASCHDGRCPGYKQRPVKVIETLTEWTYVDLGGDIPGVERSSTLLRFSDLADAQCPSCGEPAMCADQVRPIYPNVSGVPQDKLLHVNDDSDRLRDLQLADAKREAAMAQMQATLERQAAVIERLTAEPPRRGPGRPPKTVDE
jgi:hypothetical protein